MRYQKIESRRAETPAELEDKHRDKLFEGFNLVKGTLGFYLGNYGNDFPEPE